MADSGGAENLISLFFKSHNISIPKNRKHVFDKFINEAATQNAIYTIDQNQKWLMAKWKVQDRIAEIISQPVRILNASVGKSYEAKFDIAGFGWEDISVYEFEGLNEAGLRYDVNQKQISGQPTQSGDINILFKFKLKGQAEAESLNTKVITLIINPDPKSLWKNLDSDRSDPYWKEDNVTIFAPFAGRHILASSKRGRAHANVGSFREDDFAFGELADQWSIVVVSDGAGSAKISRQGSSLACNGIVSYFKSETSATSLREFDGLLEAHNSQPTESTQKNLNNFVYTTLGQAALSIHKQLDHFAAKEGITLKDLSSTLIFTVFKKYHTGYAFLSFGVGDCPMAVLSKDISEVTLLTKIDVGEFGGGTRFITMPEIFKSDKFYTRFTFKQIEDFSYLILMSDGIYDPKFVVENSLPDINKWKEFLEDLAGKNDEGSRVDLHAANANITEQLSTWMDFWSTGNHDDRTLAIIF